jgi:hypothetical protein
LRGNISKGNYSGGESLEGNFRREIFGGEFSWGNILRGMFVEGKVHRFTTTSHVN